MNKQLTLKDYEELIRRIRDEDLPAAEQKQVEVREDFDEQFFELSGRGEMAKLNRLKKAVVDATEQLDETRATLKRAIARAEQVSRSTYDEQLRERRAAVAANLDKRQASLGRLDDTVEALAKAYLDVVEINVQVIEASRESVSLRNLAGVTVEESRVGMSSVPALFTTALQNIIEQRLYGLTNGKWNTRYAGLETVTTARALPDLKKRGKKESDLMLSQLSDEPPQAA